MYICTMYYYLLQVHNMCVLIKNLMKSMNITVTDTQ